ncbi:hypothetical protein [Paenibacillus sp. FSL R5-0345]|uniref:hypothetical protein n=1 Tax=Paenibacillus sp. FSL R5-0345 TaxID=1536770 RepID=UPI0018CE13FC|nr:hypothetical protein [Paenibacillus sp. FSL R5-0345]
MGIESDSCELRRDAYWGVEQRKGGEAETAKKTGEAGLSRSGDRKSVNVAL